MGADNNPDVFQHFVPRLLLAPSINAVTPRQKPALYIMKMICDDSVLLLCKYHSGTKKPDKLLRLSVYTQNRDIIQVCVPALGHSVRAQPPHEGWHFKRRVSSTC